MDLAYRHLRHNIKYNNIQGIFSVLSLNLFTPFVPIFAIKVLHASDQQVAWLSSLPALTGILTLIPGALLLDRLEKKQSFTGAVMFFARLFMFFIALIPFFSLGNLAMWLVLLMALMNFPGSLVLLSWQSFIGGIIPQYERPRVFANRNRLTTAVGIVATMSVGYLFNLFPEDWAWPYQIFFLITFVMGMLETGYLYKLVEIPRPYHRADASRNTLSTILSSVGKEKIFIYFLLASLLFHFGWQMAWPLFNIYQIDSRFVNMNTFWISIVTVVNAFGSLLAYRMWGRLSDRYGNGRILMVSAIGMSANPYLYIFTENVTAIILINFVIGIFAAGFIQTLFNRVLDLSPMENRSFFIAVHSVLVGISAIFAPQVGVWIFQHFNMNTGFFVSGTIRLVGALTYGAVVWQELASMRRRVDVRTESGRAAG